MARSCAPSGPNQILDTMIGLTRLSALHRVIVTSGGGMEIYLELRRRGFIRVTTPQLCRHKRVQHAIGLITGPGIEPNLDQISAFLSVNAGLALRVGSADDGLKIHRKLEALGFRVEAGVRCSDGLVLSASRQGYQQTARVARGHMTISPTPMTWLSGYIPDLPTPFDAKGSVDLNAFRRLCERQISAGASAILVCETAGEASTVSPAEREVIIATAVELAHGRSRVIAGAGSNSTHHAIELTRSAEDAGADAVMSVVPYYNKPMQEGIFQHFRAIASSTALPIVVHDIPSRTMREIANSTLMRLTESPQFAGLRDGSGDLTRPMRLSSLLPPPFRYLTGEDATAPAYLTNGGHGCISTISNVTPGMCRNIVWDIRHGRLQAAWRLQKQLMPLQACLFADNPAALKYALALLGLMQPATRLPIVELDEPAKAAVAIALSGIDERQLAQVDG